MKNKKIPILGTIACGCPIFAEENYEDYIMIDDSIHADFALRCKGDSMINARIFDGDIVYIRQQSDVDNGEIAAVLIDNEATLKKVYKYQNRIELRPENPEYPIMFFKDEELSKISILGKVSDIYSAYKVEKHFLAYFDILGYKKQLHILNENKFLSIIHSALNFAFDVISNISLMSGIELKYKVFSDNILIYAPVSQSALTNKQTLTILNNSLHIIQSNLMIKHNIYIRGCVHIGNLYATNNILFGNGLVEAYNYENSIAIYPRIIISNELKKFIDKNFPEFNENNFIKDVDGLYFVNFIIGLQYDTLQTIVTNKLNNEKDTKTRQKFEWLLSVIDSNKQYFDTLKINSNEN